MLLEATIKRRFRKKKIVVFNCEAMEYAFDVIAVKYPKYKILDIGYADKKHYM